MKTQAGLIVKDLSMPNYLQVSADGKHWLTLHVSQIHPNVLRQVGRKWAEALVARSKVKPRKPKLRRDAK